MTDQYVAEIDKNNKDRKQDFTELWNGDQKNEGNG
jgi:hypothetical protein